jgi:hypothetical protein
MRHVGSKGAAKAKSIDLLVMDFRDGAKVDLERAPYS